MNLIVTLTQPTHKINQQKQIDTNQNTAIQILQESSTNPSCF